LQKFARMNDETEDDRSVASKADDDGGVKVLAASKNLFCVNPGPIKIGRKTFLMFIKHIPAYYQGKDVKSYIILNLFSSTNVVLGSIHCKGKSFLQGSR